MPSQRPSLLFTVGAVVVLLILASCASPEPESIRLVFEGVEEDSVNFIELDVPGGLTDVGAQVEGRGELTRPAQHGEDCDFTNFTNIFGFLGSVQPSSTGGFAAIRGVVEHSTIGCDAGILTLPGEFEMTIQEDGTVMGMITFPDEKEPRRIIGSALVLADEGDSTFPGIIPVEFWMFAVALVVAVAATVVCVLKGRRIYGVVGAGLSILAGAFTLEAREIDPGMLEDVLLLAAFVMLVLPLTILVVVIAWRPGKPSSWWANRPPSD